MMERTTLADLVNQKVDVFLWCYNCIKGATLSSADLARRLGPSFLVPDIKRKCRCSVCGSSNLSSRPDWQFPTVSRDRHPPARQATRPTAQQLRLL